MESDTFKSMSIDDLWTLREQVVAALVDRIAEEQAKLEERLRKIEKASNVIRLDHRRS
jgi:DNA-binding protein H-NS